MNFEFKYALLFIVSLGLGRLAAQETVSGNYRLREIEIIQDTTRLDSLPIFESTFEINCPDSSWYRLDGLSALLIWKGPLPFKTQISYRVFNFNPKGVFSHKELSQIGKKGKTTSESFKFSTVPSEDFFGGNGLKKSGSISRGAMFGNNQDFSINSNLNLQLSGEVSSGISILASITDDNLPIQPDGNSQQLQDFDQVYIQLFADDWQLTAGDFWMKKPKGHFLNYNKRAQGASYTISSTSKGNIRAKNGISAAISKGKFARNIFMGVEGNQGPYKLKGAENEQFIILLSGTESVYIDGKLLTRGQDNDYIIDYNTAEISFTTNFLITKDKRIIVEFQYSDKNFARTIIQSSNEYKFENWKFHVNAYSEQDSKNQPLQQNLSVADKVVLYNVGDALSDAVVLSSDSTEFIADQVRYRKLDSLGYEVFLYSNDPNKAFYKLVFSDVGNGNYIEDNFSPFGKVYKWVAPDTVGGVVVKKGKFEPVKILITPKKRQLFNAGFENVKGALTVYGEAAMSNTDVNTFSPKDAGDNIGLGFTGGIKHIKGLKNDWKLKSHFMFETVAKNFQGIERFREAEFERNWNMQQVQVKADQYFGNGGVSFEHPKSGKLSFQSNAFVLEDNYLGKKQDLNLNFHNKLEARLKASYLNSSGINTTRFYRHKARIAVPINNYYFGYEDELELNLYQLSDSLLSGTYHFYDKQFFIENRDSSNGVIHLFYRERTDYLMDNQRLEKITFARNPGVSYTLKPNVNHQLKYTGIYRVLDINNEVLTSQKPDKTLLNRIDYGLKILKGGLVTSSFYELGSGLELKKQFTYLEVPAGQGVYTWIDYNNNEIKELNEFETAVFQDQATYIRVFTPSNTYVSVYSNQFNQTASFTPSRFVRGSDFFARFIQKIASQTSWRTERKTSEQNFRAIANPFEYNYVDTSLQAVTNQLRHSSFFNRNHPVFGLEHTFLELNSKSLLSNGFDTRNKRSNLYKLRINVGRKFTLQCSYENGNKQNFSEFAPIRDFNLFYNEVEQKISWQPSTTFRLSGTYLYKEKQNSEKLGNQKAEINDFGLQVKLNQIKKGSINAGINWVLIDYISETNNSLGFEMLEGLLPGKNITWKLSVQRSLANNLQLTLNYSGRTSIAQRIIHNGGVQVRAYF